VDQGLVGDRRGRGAAEWIRRGANGRRMEAGGGDSDAHDQGWWGVSGVRGEVAKQRCGEEVKARGRRGSEEGTGWGDGLSSAGTSTTKLYYSRDYIYIYI
jgi:hypothetical protein